MSGTPGDRLVHLRSQRSLSGRELAARVGVPYQELLALENGARRDPPPDVIRRLADFFHTTAEFILNGTVPSPAVLRASFFRYYDSLSAPERQALKFAPIEARIEAVLNFMADAFPTLFERAQVAAQLGYTPQALEDVLRGAAPLYSPLLKRLIALVGLPQDFIVRGDFFGGAESAHSTIDPDRLNQYYEVVQEAVSLGISPATLRKAIRILSIRDQEE